MISIIVPAYNEESYLVPTLASLGEAARIASEALHQEVEIIVVDNASTDRTADLARALNATLVVEPTPGIARARNAGARNSSGELLIFVDADTIVPPELVVHVMNAVNTGHCIGGAVGAVYRPIRRSVAVYLWVWKYVARAFQMAQGVTQFATREAFEAVGRYDEALFMSEDVDFFWRLRALGAKTNRCAVYLTEVTVQPSCRRWDIWPLWKILVWTNPITVRLFLRSKRFWRHWYAFTVR